MFWGWPKEQNCFIPFVNLGKLYHILAVNTFGKTPLKRLRFRSPTLSKYGDSDFLLKLNTISACFKQDIFHNNLNNNVYGQIHY